MKRFLLLFFLLIFVKGYGQEIKVPEVTFPIEIIATKQEKKPFLTPPDKIELKEKVKIKLFVEEVKPIPPYDVKPPVIPFEKPSSFLGIPEENALMSEAVDDFLNKRYLPLLTSGRFLQGYLRMKTVFQMG